MQQESTDSLVRKVNTAWLSMRNSGVDLDLPDAIAHADIHADWDNLQFEIVKNIQEGDCYPKSVEIVDLPKGRLAVRPLARLDLLPRLAFESAVVGVADSVQRSLTGAVFSSTWWSRERRLLSPTRRWIDMQRSARRYHRRNPEMYLANTDISSFYEHIEINILLDDLTRIGAPEVDVASIGRFLEAFNQLSSAWGLPQGSDMSGILANLYLSTFDFEIRRGKFRHFRYSDDTYIFGSDWNELRGLLVRVNQALRHRHLNLSGSKTEIVAGEDVLKLLEDREKDAIKYGLHIRANWAVKALKQLFRSATTTSPPNVRDITFCLTNFGFNEMDDGVDWVLENFNLIPNAAKSVFGYLRRMIDVRQDIRPRMAEVIGSPWIRHYPYAQQHVIVFCLQNGIASRRLSDLAWEILIDRNAESFVREIAARYLGLHGHRPDSGHLKQLYQLEENYRVRRCLLVSCYESGQCSDEWLRTIEKNDSALRLVSRYLQSPPNAIPLPITERSY